MKKTKKNRNSEEIQFSASKWLSKILTERSKNKELSKTEESHIKQLCDVLLWKFSEIHGCEKTDNPLWSLRAVELEKQDDISSRFISDHSVPRKVLISHLIELKNPTPDNVYQLLKPLCMVVVITKCEDDLLNLKEVRLKQKMPVDWDGKDPFARYTHDRVNIKVTVRPGSNVVNSPIFNNLTLV